MKQNFHAFLIAVVVFAAASSAYAQPDLFEIAREGTQAQARAAILAGAKIDARSSDGETPLMVAADIGNEQVVRALIEAGANVNARTTDGVTPLMRAATRTIVDLLLGAGADPHAQTSNASTALHELIRSEADTDALKRLLELGLDPNAHASAQDGASYDTPLHVAAWQGTPEHVAALIEYGADPNAGDASRDLPLFTAMFRYYFRGGTDGALEVVRLLVEAGTDVNSTDEDGMTPLMLAARRGGPNMVDLLLDLGADPLYRHTELNMRAIDFARDNRSLNGTDTYWRLNDLSFD